MDDVRLARQCADVYPIESHHIVPLPRFHK